MRQTRSSITIPALYNNFSIKPSKLWISALKMHSTRIDENGFGDIRWNFAVYISQIKIPCRSFVRGRFIVYYTHILCILRMPEEYWKSCIRGAATGPRHGESSPAQICHRVMLHISILRIRISTRRSVQNRGNDASIINMHRSLLASNTLCESGSTTIFWCK